MTRSRSLATRSVEKPWGRNTLPPPFGATGGKRIGEIWFEPPPELDALLVKYLFTSEKLSVQVHPSDAEAPAGSRGKEECWLVLDAQPGAQLALGFREPIDAEAMRAAALDGSIEQLLAWHDVAPGDFFYLSAGTVHAIGAGLSLIEIQQNSDVTYRLFDYGRPRELHLDAAIAVARRGRYDSGCMQRVPARGSLSLVDGPHFRLDRLEGAPTAEAIAAYAGAPLLVIPLDGEVTLSGETLAPGSCGLAAELADLSVPEHGHALIAQPLQRQELSPPN